MKNFRKLPQKLFLLLAGLMLAILPSVNVYSAVGDYQTSSDALTANTLYDKGTESELAAWPLAVAAGVGLGVVFVVGVVDGWNSHHKSIMSNESLDTGYDQGDFTEFDN